MRTVEQWKVNMSTDGQALFFSPRASLEITHCNLFHKRKKHTAWDPVLQLLLVLLDMTHLSIVTCTTGKACLPLIRGLENCRFIGHNPHFSILCSLSCLNPKVLPKDIYFELVLCQAFLGLWLVEGSQLWYKWYRALGSCGVYDTLALIGFAS